MVIDRVGGVKISGLVRALPSIDREGTKLDKVGTREYIEQRLPLIPRAVHSVTGWYPHSIRNELLDKAEANAPRRSYMVDHNYRDRKHDPAIDLISSSIKNAINQGLVDPREVKALIVGGSRFRAGHPGPARRVLSGLAREHIVQKKIIEGDDLESLPGWYIPGSINDGCNTFNKVIDQARMIMDEEMNCVLVALCDITTGYEDPRELFNLTNHRDGCVLLVLRYDAEASDQIILGKDEIHIDAFEKVVHNYERDQLSWSDTLGLPSYWRNARAGYKKAKKEAVELSNHIARYVVNRFASAENIDVFNYDSILVPPLNNKFLRLTETKINAEFRNYLGISKTIRDELKSFIPDLNDGSAADIDEEEEKGNGICSNFSKVIKYMEANQNNESSRLYLKFYKNLNKNEKMLFDFMVWVHNGMKINYTAYNAFGYTAAAWILLSLSLIDDLDKRPVLICDGSLGQVISSAKVNPPKPVEKEVDEDTVLEDISQAGIDTDPEIVIPPSLKDRMFGWTRVFAEIPWGKLVPSFLRRNGHGNGDGNGDGDGNGAQGVSSKSSLKT